MAEKVCCPGPIGGNNGNSAGGFREAVCVHTKKVYDSCRSKECLRDIRVYLTRDAQELINAGGIASVKPREAELLCVSIDVERIQFNRGFYSVDIRFFYRIECEISCVIGRPRIVDGLAVFDKRVVLFGGEGGARIFSSQYIEDGRDVQLRPDSNKPTAVVEVVDPIMLDARVVAPETSCNCCCQSIKCYWFTKRQKKRRQPTALSLTSPVFLQSFRSPPAQIAAVHSPPALLRAVAAPQRQPVAPYQVNPRPAAPTAALHSRCHRR